MDPLTEESVLVFKCHIGALQIILWSHRLFSGLALSFNDCVKLQQCRMNGTYYRSLMFQLLQCPCFHMIMIFNVPCWNFPQANQWWSCQEVTVPYLSDVVMRNHISQLCQSVIPILALIPIIETKPRNTMLILLHTIVKVRHLNEARKRFWSSNFFSFKNMCSGGGLSPGALAEGEREGERREGDSVSFSHKDFGGGSWLESWKGREDGREPGEWVSLWPDRVGARYNGGELIQTSNQASD